MAYGLCCGRPSSPALKKTYMDIKKQMKNLKLGAVPASELADRMEHELCEDGLRGKASGSRSITVLSKSSKKTKKEESGAGAPLKAPVTAAKAQLEPMLRKTEGNKDIGPSTSKYAAMRQRLGMGALSEEKMDGKKERNGPHIHTRRGPKIPSHGQPGAFNDPLRRGLSGAGCRWYLRYLEKGFSPEEARKRAEEHRVKEAAPSAQSASKRGGKVITPIQQKESKRCKMDGSSQKKAGETVGRSASKSYADVSKAVRLAILPKDYPEVNLTASEQTVLEEAIICEIAKGWTCKIKFEGIHFRPGYILVECKDAQTAEWTKLAVPRLSKWKGAPLTVCSGDEVPRAHNVTFFLPRSAGQTTEQIMALIGAQNDGLRMSLWRILKAKDEGNGKLMTVGIDEQSLEAIRSAGNAISYRFGEVPVHGSRKKNNPEHDCQEEDAGKEIPGEKAAVTPPGKTLVDDKMELSGEREDDAGEGCEEEGSANSYPCEEEEKMLLSGSSVSKGSPRSNS